MRVWLDYGGSSTMTEPVDASLVVVEGGEP